MRRILIVDDDRGVRLTLRQILQRAGHLTAEAADGRGCLQTIDTFRPDLLLLDILMPGGDGLETMLALRRSACGTPIVAMSGGGQRLTGGSLLETAALMGAAATLAKPIRSADLLQAVDRWTGSPERAAGASGPLGEAGEPRAPAGAGI